MDFLQNGVRTLKRHSIANITDALRSHIHRDSVYSSGRRSPYSAADFPMKNPDFASVSTAVVHLFQRKKLQENELTTLQEAVRNLVTTDTGPLIYDYYKDNLIKRGMVILREKIKGEIGEVLLTDLGRQWDYFYKEILPLLQAILHPITTTSLTVRQVALLEFRNTVVLKLPVKVALRDVKEIPPPILQMLLVLQNVPESPCTDNKIKLEKMVARVTSPYLGVLGLYVGGSEPEIRSNFKYPPEILPIYPQPVIEITLVDDPSDSEGDMSAVEHKPKLYQMSPLLETPLNHKRNLLPLPLLTAVQEKDRGQIRRYSIATS